MLKNRIIPCLLLKNGGLVKTIKFSNPKYVGDPINAIRIFNEKEVDELMVIDIDATKDQRDPDFALIKQFAGECFMPLCYGGGINSVDQVKRLFSLGVEKVCLQAAAIKNPSLITDIAMRFGSQSVLVSVDIKKNWFGRPNTYLASTGQIIKQHLPDFLKNIVEAGAGEIVLNAVDRDGKMEGMDIELITKVSSMLSVPLIAIGGVGNLNHIKAALEAGASAVAAGSFFVFHGPHRAVLITYPHYNDLQKLINS